jgi:DNA-directed RNA polymerase subunit RPC12/RpoP
MAHKDACKIQTTQFAKKLIDNGIPASTIRRWWYEVIKETAAVFKNEHGALEAITNECDNVIDGNQTIKVIRGGARIGSGRKPNGRTKYAVCPKCGHIFKSNGRTKYAVCPKCEHIFKSKLPFRFALLKSSIISENF